MIDTGGKFFLGGVIDPSAGEVTKERLLYDPDDLTTHAVVVGMTGSGKTGLCLDILEEAALQGIPDLMIDPKGDIGNALLHFPRMQPGDFKPWVNIDQARREGKTASQAANDTAKLWRNGLSKWGIGTARLQALKDAVQFTLFTPGSDAGLPVNILASFKAPDIDWGRNREILRERISGTVTAVLGLTGMADIDPVRSKEHILLANIFEHAWSKGRDLDLAELIMQTQTPPFEKLGVFETNTFFPEKERFGLAMQLNNILAAPTFQDWIHGQPLDIQGLLYTDDGRPRHSIFYIAHLDDQERMFFVSLLFTAVETWMRTQKGSTSTRALIYFDEIFGYLPPVGNPPSKESMLRMLKQARAYGVGLILATQNPVDIDYKALSNAGTWFIGKLQTDQDKQRLLDGLMGASGGLNRAEYDRLISTLGKRVFLLHNVHEKQPSLFRTRWAMNYLAGPLTRDQIPALNRLAGHKPAPVEPALAQKATAAAYDKDEDRLLVQERPPAFEGSKTRPTVPRDIDEFFLPNNLSLSEAARITNRALPASIQKSGMLYRPILLAQASIAFTNRKYNLKYNTKLTAFVEDPDRRGMVRWDDFLVHPIEPRSVEGEPVPDARFSDLEEPLNDSRIMRTHEKDFVDWCYQTVEVNVKANEKLKVYAGPEISESDFEKMCAAAIEKELKEDIEIFLKKHKGQIERIEEKLKREKRELKEDEAELSMRKGEESISHVETLVGLFGGRRRSLSASMSKRRMTERAKADVEESIEAIEEFEEELEDLEEEMKESLEDLKEQWQEIAGETIDIPVKPYKKDIRVELFGVAWVPYHQVEGDDGSFELPGFAQES
jgi:hypothetical protein